MARGDRFTIEKVKPELYSDFTVNFDRNPLTGLLARVTNEESVKNSVRNLIKTIRRERFNQPLTGSKLHALLFDEVDDVTSDLIKETILSTIKTDEPRALNPTVVVEALPVQNSYRVTVVFGIVNIPQQVSFSTILKRIR